MCAGTTLEQIGKEWEAGLGWAGPLRGGKEWLASGRKRQEGKRREEKERKRGVNSNNKWGESGSSQHSKSERGRGIGKEASNEARKRGCWDPAPRRRRRRRRRLTRTLDDGRGRTPTRCGRARHGWKWTAAGRARQGFRCCCFFSPPGEGRLGWVNGGLHFLPAVKQKKRWEIYFSNALHCGWSKE